MSKTLVLQSHRHPLPISWLETCIDSVKSWAGLNKFEYQFLGDELLDYEPAPFPVHIVFPQTKLTATRVRAFVDWMTVELRKTLNLG